MAVSNTNIRLMLIQEDDSVALTEALIDMWSGKAAKLQSSADDDALEFYTCYLMAKSWQSLGFVTKDENITFKEPVPERFLDLYNDRINETNTDSTSAYPFQKVSTNKDFKVDETTNVFVREDYLR